MNRRWITETGRVVTSTYPHPDPRMRREGERLSVYGGEAIVARLVNHIAVGYQAETLTGTFADGTTVSPVFKTLRETVEFVLR